jgi:hypothetical protein
MDTSFEYLLKEVRLKKELIEGSIISGKLDSYEYKRLCGMVQGLDFTKELINDLAKKLEEV